MYSKYRQNFNLTLLGTRSDNAVLYNLSIEANRVYEIYGFFIYQIVVGTASTALDLELDGVVIGTCAYGNTGAGTIKTSATTFPISITGAAAGSRLQITQNVAEVSATSLQVVTLNMSTPMRTAV